METFQPWLMPVYSTVVGIIIGLLYAKIQSLVTKCHVCNEYWVRLFILSFYYAKLKKGM